MWNCEKIWAELDKKIKEENFITYRDIINQSVTQFKKVFHLMNKSLNGFIVKKLVYKNWLFIIWLISVL